MEKTDKKTSVFGRPIVQSIAGIVLIAATLGGLLYWKHASSYISVDASQISAPVISVSPETPGVLSEVYVKPGDKVNAGQALAIVGGQPISSQISGVVLTVKNTPGQMFAAGSPVVSMIDPTQLRVVGKIDEDKGLSRIKVGDPVTFTVDAFGSRQFTGIVDEVSPTADDISVVFNISDKRAVKQFDIKVKFDISSNPEFKNGMSAKMNIYAK